jgi:hypothetical protein
MKKIVAVGLACVAGTAIAGFTLFRAIAAIEASQGPVTEVSPKSAKGLQQKIDAVKSAEHDARHQRGSKRVDISEAELQSYLLYSLKDEIPAKIDSAEIRLAPDTISLDTQITFASNATGNQLVDVLLGGTHNLFLKGKLTGNQGRGKFDLLEIRVDSIPVPNILIQSLIKKYVKPKYPEADLSEPFDLPWGIEELKLESGKATVVY